MGAEEWMREKLWSGCIKDKKKKKRKTYEDNREFCGGSSMKILTVLPDYGAHCCVVHGYRF